MVHPHDHHKKIMLGYHYCEQNSFCKLTWKWKKSTMKVKHIPQFTNVFSRLFRLLEYHHPSSLLKLLFGWCLGINHYKSPSHVCIHRYMHLYVCIQCKYNYKLITQSQKKQCKEQQECDLYNEYWHLCMIESPKMREKNMLHHPSAGHGGISWPAKYPAKNDLWQLVNVDNPIPQDQLGLYSFYQD